MASLSIDIVQEIFKNFSTRLIIPIPDSDQRRREECEWKPFPWYLGQICSLWRIAFSSMYSDFWCTISIIVDRRYPPTVWDDALSMAKVFLERTDGRPFSFSINSKHPCPPVLDLFISESTRWKDVFLCLDDEDVNISLLRSVKNRIPQLRSLAFTVELGMPRDLPSIFKDVPALVHLSLVHLGGWCMDWNMLTRLELSREINVDRLLRILSQTINLELLSFNRLAINPEDFGEKDITPVTLPRLQTLETSTFVIFKYLTTPALKRLYIYKSSAQESLDATCSAFFERSACRLQQFGCTCLFLQDFIDIFPHMPDLEVLSVCNPPFAPGRDFVVIMTCKKGQKPLLPKLRLLRVSSSRWPSDYKVKLNEMMDSRVSDRIMHSVQELKVIVTAVVIRKAFKHPNIESRLTEEYKLDYDLSTQARWVCDDSDC